MMRKKKGLYLMSGFTLVEVMTVIAILAILSAIAIPRLTSSSDLARRNADIATGHQLKTALERYQVENGLYPKRSEMSSANGVVTCSKLIPKYITNLNTSTTQQMVEDGHKGFAVEAVSADGVYPVTADHLIVIYLSTDGSTAEVRVFDKSLTKVLWSSVD